MQECLSFIRMILPFVKKYRWLCGFIFLALLVEMAFNAALPMCFKFIVDNILLGDQKGVFGSLLSGMMIGAVLVSLIGLARDRYYATLTARILSDIRQLMFSHLNALSMNFYSKAKIGDLISHFSNDLYVVEVAISDAVSWAILPGLDMLASVVLLFTIDWRLACISMLVWPVCLIGPKIFAPRVAGESYQLKQAEADTLSIIQESLSAQPVIKSYNLASPLIERFRGQNEVLTRICSRLAFFGSLVERSANVGVLILQVLVLGIGAVMVSRQMLTLGSLTAFQTIFANLSNSLSSLTQYLPEMVEATGGMRRIDELLRETPQVDESLPGRELDKINGEITFKAVSFGYSPERLNLKAVDLVIGQGRSVAFVGPSGSGKSTILNLAMRSYDPLAGSVQVDGIDLRDLSLASLRAHTAVVFQESFLFNASIRENIRIGRLDATDAEIESAARAAEIHDAIIKLPAGYNTLAGERGRNLSGGQRQRIAIARAILRDPGILILDEATSALDQLTEDSINKTLLHLCRNRTTLSVTHRLSSVKHVDQINYLEDGQIIESGSFAELMALNGAFHSLWEKQQGFSLAEDGTVSVTAERIRSIPIFSVLDPEIVNSLVKLFASENAQPERVVTAEGDIGEHLYLIVRGKVEVLKRLPDGSQAQLAVLSDGDFFGEIALLRAVPRTATVKTLTHCVFLTMHRRHFLNFIQHHPELKKKVEATVKERLSHVDALSFNISTGMTGKQPAISA
ncbi:MAG TPA: ABC transporter transmembrane domain-containing protein [Candidatus Rifleibacterium sp.]|nr:ABC transporter transmembrane domain-containing protein [Candidatus Rifleibacterium sp.]HPT46799.1 ABC transporter transmembrane domain-containing protein [Candidatus Rifleibacterium sp.]